VSVPEVHGGSSAVLARSPGKSAGQGHLFRFCNENGPWEWTNGPSGEQRNSQCV